MKIHLFFSLAFALLFCELSAQEATQFVEKNRSNDSLRTNELLNIANSYYQTNIDSANILATQALELAKSNNLIYEKAWALNTLGNLSTNIGDLNKAMEYYQEAYDWLNANNIKDFRLFSSSLNLGRIKVLLGNYTEGIDFLEQALKLAEKSKDLNSLSIAFINLGHVFFDLERFDVSKEYYVKALYFAYKNKSKLRISGVLTDLGNVYFKKNQYRRALHYYTSSNKFKEKLLDSYGMTITLLNIGSCHHMIGEETDNLKLKKESFETALKYYSQSLALSKELNLKANESLALNNIGVLNIQIGNFSEGVKYCHEAEKIAEQTGELIRKQEAYDCLYLGYKKLNEGDKALIYLENFNEIKENLFSSESLKRANQLQFEREFAFREAIQKAELDKERVLSEIRNRQQQYKIGILILLLSLAMIIVILLIRQRRKTVQNYREIVRKNVELMKSEAEFLAYKEKFENEKLKAVNIESLYEEISNPAIADEEIEMKESKFHISEEHTSHLLNRITDFFYKEKIFLNEELTLSTLAEKLNSNTTYVSRVINDSFGKNFSVVISELRVKEARRMLADRKFNNLTIEGIARETGFRSIPSFNRAFKSYTGVSPSFFKQTAQEGLHQANDNG